jgi:hypothetical protein
MQNSEIEAIETLDCLFVLNFALVSSVPFNRCLSSGI